MNDKTSWIDRAWSETIGKVKRTSVRIGDNFPSMTEKGTYALEKDYWRWVTAFWPGLLWLLYEECGDETFKSIAESCEAKMDGELFEYLNLHHDVGFMWCLTSVKNYTLSGSRESRKRALIAASHLASRFNIRGNYLRAWNINHFNKAVSAGLSIIDSMMNLPLLFWSSEELDDPRFSHIAEAHADTVLKEFIREDGSVNHMVEFDPQTGQAVAVHSGQGYAKTSAWSRGASWALHGMALAYRYTKKQCYLDASRKVADFFIDNLPEDHVAYWDFRAPQQESIARDTSAAACAACGMLELSRHLPDSESPKYRRAAANTVRSLFENYGNWDDDGEEGLISGGTLNHPAGLGINVSLIYGDYYFVESLWRLRRDKSHE